ncbi:MAG: D-2-hydroxyacid dehydrogenase [Acidobacteriia bacterium]|nr:D-2-hydroxyacid dehydrogenase [Terriglobia bacterium]
MKLLTLVHHSFELWNTPSWFSARLHQDFPTVEAVQRSSYEGIEPYLRDAEVIISWSLRPEQFKAAPKLRWIHSPAAAVHQLMFPELINSDVVLTNAREVHGPVVAEHVMAMVFALAKCLPQAVRFQQKHIWGQEPMWRGHPRPRELAGATVGLVGLGSISRAVAKHASNLGMRVIAVRENPEKGSPEGVQQVFASSQVDQLLAQSDYVVLAVPVTPLTKRMMNAARLANMKSDACLINVGRGPLVDEEALAQALREKTIGGAALDVFEAEPLPADSPLWDLENLLITPHTAGLTEKLWERHYQCISENLRRYLQGEPLHSVVDKKQGY